MLLSLTACYEGKIKKAYEELKIGASKTEIDRLFKEFKFIKEQTILVYGSIGENETRGSIWSDKHYEDVQPGIEILVPSLTFDGNTKVFTYLINKESAWPNGHHFYYVAIFYDKLNDKVIGKAIMATSDYPENWSEKF